MICSLGWLASLLLGLTSWLRSPGDFLWRSRLPKELVDSFVFQLPTDLLISSRVELPSVDPDHGVGRLGGINLSQMRYFRSVEIE